MATVRALSNAVEARDAYTGKHAERVTAYGLLIARRATAPALASSPPIEFGFLLHDIGKLADPGRDPVQVRTAQHRGARADGPASGDRRRDRRPDRLPGRRRCRSSATITSGGTAPAIPTGCAAPRSRWRPGSSPSPTCSTRSPPIGPYRSASPLAQGAGDDPRREPAPTSIRRSSRRSPRSRSSSCSTLRRRSDERCRRRRS